MDPQVGLTFQSASVVLDNDFVDSMGILAETPHIPDTPERALMRAVFEQVIQDIDNGDIPARRRPGKRSQSTLYRLAIRWVFTSDYSWWPFSFENICETLAYNPAYIRKQILLRRRINVQSVEGNFDQSRRRISITRARLSVTHARVLKQDRAGARRAKASHLG